MITPRDFRGVRAALVEGNGMYRGEMRSALIDKGIREPITCKNIDAFLEVASNEVLDLIVCDSAVFGGEFAAAMQRLRKNDLGGNPFAVVIATVQDASLGQVRDVLNGGVDDLLRRPAPAKKIVDRIDYLVKDRKPFVATRGYVGPTRSGLTQSGADAGELVEVPNTLRSKVVEKKTDAQLRKAITAAAVGLMEKMAEHPLAGIDRLIQRALTWRDGSGDDLRRDFNRLTALSLEMSSHYRGTSYDHIADLAVALAGLAKRIAGQDPPGMGRVDADLLANLGAAIRGFIASENESGEVVREIAVTVKRFVGKAKPATGSSTLH